MILDHVDALLSRIPDQGVSRNIEKLIEQESLLSFLFLLRVCTVATSTKVIVGKSAQHIHIYMTIP
ncbi:hypothetical protein EON65_16460 [archaeon]|nr:MAG: hypothetical protein EON65_16460 [archaeon]